VRQPTYCKQGIRIRVAFQYRSPYGFANQHLFRFAAFNVDRLSVGRKFSWPPGRDVGLRCVAEPDDNGIGPIAVAVGVAPGDMSVAAGNEQRCARQRYAVEVAWCIAVNDQTRTVKNIRGRYSEMHVVRNDGMARISESAGDRPVIAANNEVVAGFSELASGRRCTNRYSFQLRGRRGLHRRSWSSLHR